MALRCDLGELITAMVTPMDNQKEIDYPSLEKVTKHLIEQKTDAIVVAGTTGESPTLTHEEEYEILRQQFEIELAQAVEKLERLEKQRSKFNRLFTVDSWISELRQYSSSKKLSASMLNAFVKCVRVYADNRIEIEWKHKDAIAEYLELVNGGVGLVG